MSNGATLIMADRQGDGFPVVLLHGLGGSSNTFQTVMDALRPYRALRPDLPAAARSYFPAQTVSMASMAQDICDWIDDEGITRFALCGHSLGTILCQMIAARWPGRVSGMVLFGAITTPADVSRTGLRARAELARKDGMAGIADQIIDASLSASTHRENPAAVAFVRESLMRQPAQGYAAMCDALAEARLVDALKIDAPTLLITGQDDPVSPPSMARQLGNAIRDATVEVLPGCGHWVTLEKPLESRALMAAFLASHTH